MDINHIDKQLIEKIAKGSEAAFSSLYKSYYAYLNAIAIYYIFDKNIASVIVNDVFMNIWDRRTEIVYPVHSYIVRSVQNGCLNYIRSQRIRDAVHNSHAEEVSKYEENRILQNPDPLRDIEMKELENQIKDIVNELPPKCRNVFELYFYKGKSADEIAQEMDLSVNTVRVQIKNALDRIKKPLNKLLFFFLCLNF